jgi:hypothetical protein
MRRLPHDETPFLSVVQLKTTTLAWWPDDSNVIPLDTHDRDRSARDETSYPPTNPLGILSFIILGPPFLTDKCFIAFLVDSWEKHLEGLFIGFYLLPNKNPYGPSSPSSHRMRDNPFLGQYTLKSKEIRKWGGEVMKSGKYGWEWYNGSSREFLVANPFPKKNTY